MEKIEKFYKRNIYGIIGTLFFHSLLVSSFLLSEINMKGKIKEEPIIIDFSMIEEFEEKNIDKKQNIEEDKNEPSQVEKDLEYTQKSNQAVNDAPIKDPFFDEAYRKEIAEAQKLVSDVNNQLLKEEKEIEKFIMPEQSTEGMPPDSIKNTIYSGESNIHYSLKNRYHLRMPIPVYLAQGGGLITVAIWVNTKGKVIRAEVKDNNTIDPMLQVYAKHAAMHTLFNKDQSAPSPQKGTIAYTFIAQ